MTKTLATLLISSILCASAQNYTYDKDGVLTKVELADKSQITYHFDKSGNLLTQNTTQTPVLKNPEEKEKGK
jgi:YD repeat-containing protein